METQINQTEIPLNMHNVKNFIISVTSGAGVAFWNWEKLYTASISIVVGIIVSVGSFLIIRWIQKYIFKDMKKPKEK